MSSTAEILVTVAAVLAAVVLLWVVPIYFGVRNFRRKGYSAHWMWCAFHPLLGYIAMIVSFAITPRKQCTNCGGWVQDNWRICPYCGHREFAPPPAGA